MCIHVLTYCLLCACSQTSLFVSEYFSILIVSFVLLDTLYLSLIPFYVPTLPVVEFFSVSLIPPLSIAFSPFPLLFLLLSPLIYLNHPPGENRSPPQSGTNCFVRFTHPEPNPDKRSLVRTAVLFVFARVTDCAVIKVFIVPLRCSCGCREGLKPHSTSKVSQIWSRGQMARNAAGTNEISPNCY